MVYLGVKWTYSQLHEMVQHLAANLHRLGVREGDKVILYLPNCPQWIVAWFALMRLRVVAIPVSPIYTPADLTYMANDSGAESIFCLDTNFGYVSQVLPETALKRVIFTNIADSLPWWKRLIGIGFNKIPTGKAASGENIFKFGKLLKNVSLSSLPLFPGRK